MSWTFRITSWRFEADWEGLTVTPLTDDDQRRRKELERERGLALELAAPKPIEHGEEEAWA